MRYFFIFLCLMNFPIFGEEKIRVYFAGSMFDIQELIGNEALAKAIEAKSHHRFDLILPQNLMQVHTNAKEIRNQDIQTLLSCDVGIFNFNGEELDSGTVVEYMMAKFIDMPTVILRTDYRDAAPGCQTWNLMTKFYPRNETLLFDGLQLYSENKDNSQQVLDFLAMQVVDAIDKVFQSKKLLSQEDEKVVRNWIEVLMKS